MREYKFRVWDKDTKRMHICGEDIHDEIDFEQGTNKAFYYNLQNGCGSLTENSSYILMQYTGLKDKNGKEIYEGDILTNGDKNIKYIVEWIDTGLKARQYNNQSYIGLNYWKDNLEVIGNIYDNPELLEM